MLHSKRILILLAIVSLAAGADRERSQDRSPPSADALPAGAAVRLGTTRFRHGSFGLKGLAFLPDGKTLVTAGETAQVIRFWETSTGRLLREMSTGSLLVRGFALSPDGTRLALTGHLDRTPAAQAPALARILEVSSGKILVDLARASDEMDGSPVFTPDGRRLVTLYRSGTFRVEEIPTGVQVLRRQFAQDSGGRFEMSRDEMTLAGVFGPNARGVYVWDWKKPAEPRVLKADNTVLERFALSPDGRQLATSGYEGKEGRLFLWDTASGRLLRRLERPGARYLPYHVAYSPDGKTLATTSLDTTQAGKIHLWDPAQGRLKGELDCGAARPRLLAFAPDSRLLAADTGSDVRVWDIRSGKELAANDAAHASLLNEITFSTKGLIATASRDNTARVWDGATGRQLHKLVHGRDVGAVAFSPDGSLLATSCVGSQVPTSGLDDVVCIWDAKTGRQIHKLAGHGAAASSRTLGFTPDGKRLLSWGTDFHLRVWDITTGKAVHDHALQPSGVTLPPQAGPPPPRIFFFLYLRTAFTADGKTLVLALTSNFHVFDVATGKEIAKFPRSGGRLISMALSSDGKKLLESAQGEQPQARVHSISLWDLGSGKLLKTELVPENGAGPVAFAPDGKQFAAAVSKPEPAIRFWDSASGKELPALTGLRDDVLTLAFSPDGKRLVAGLKDTSALVWDLTRRR